LVKRKVWVKVVRIVWRRIVREEVGDSEARYLIVVIAICIRVVGLCGWWRGRGRGIVVEQRPI